MVERERERGKQCLSLFCGAGWLVGFRGTAHYPLLFLFLYKDMHGRELIAILQKYFSLVCACFLLCSLA